ncbi:hypothetical protein SERLA73DRAFT_181689 [Serpula lacrymans var. lacrymans S7.3]|uniref:Uncharacterized protein n=2 Tax=Serpula lacrymans var. lacrymans TaxID=341189 RepID=F8PYI3_SERL3|nr:uncharacterized protein SERLADRAFT_468004 [Serpula lacrymans var. lacrymans S7.9]EGN98946.1 hypothetical protein SERLA73DRAFT_181689 [Serpula lacrymans var. lacrymans S7.3]EGO24535.1 hypothetical protein SERLADRAFT_468004 [Serpula lacrymans var. lacrymans S7.9]
MQGYFQRRILRIEATFGISMLEPWEKFFYLTVVFLLAILVFTGLYQYLPQHLIDMQRRVTYYLWGGSESEERLLQHLWDATTKTEL